MFLGYLLQYKSVELYQSFNVGLPSDGKEQLRLFIGKLLTSGEVTFCEGVIRNVEIYPASMSTPVLLRSAIDKGS